MKFLLIHNQYSNPGGEESVVNLQRQLLIAAGHSVVEYIRKHGEVGRLQSFFTALYSPRAVREIRALIQRENPDVALVHNLFPVISAAILPVLKKAGVRIVMTLHNYRLVCPNGLFYTHGKACERCGTSLFGVANCAFYRCQGSLSGSVAWSVRGAWSRRYFTNVDKFMALSDFQRDKILQYSRYQPSKFEIVPNCIDTDSMPQSRCPRLDYVGFVGRLSAEKGVALLFETARLLPQTAFKVAGASAAGFTMTDIPPNIELLGRLDKQQLADFYSGARCVILTSSCYEGFPLTVIEAMYYRATVIVPNWAALPQVVGSTGVLYTPNSASDLAAKIQENNDLGQVAHDRVVDKFSATKYAVSLVSTGSNPRNVK